MEPLTIARVSLGIIILLIVLSIFVTYSYLFTPDVMKNRSDEASVSKRKTFHAANWTLMVFALLGAAYMLKVVGDVNESRFG